MTGLTTEFLGFRFAQGSQSGLMQTVLDQTAAPYGYVVTPNVDFVTRAAENAYARNLYDQAKLQVCDSRVLRLLARTRGLHLSCYPGSDLIADLMAAGGYGKALALVGPDATEFAALKTAYPNVRMSLIETGQRLAAGSSEWNACLDAAIDAEWDVLLICLGSPKQEQFASDLGDHPHATGRRGIGLCVGASIDFLTGRQKRAPRLMQTMHLEWAFRLASNPRRLWRRYLVSGPKMVRLYFSEMIVTDWRPESLGLDPWSHLWPRLVTPGAARVVYSPLPRAADNEDGQISRPIEIENHLSFEYIRDSGASCEYSTNIC